MKKIPLYLVLVAGALLSLGPYLMTVNAAFKSKQEILTSEPWAPPANPILTNFAEVWRNSSRPDMAASRWQRSVRRTRWPRPWVPAVSPPRRRRSRAGTASTSSRRRPSRRTRPKRQQQTSSGSLHASSEVLGVCAAGKTNREIASSLFISVKTASVHVSNILRKLDVPARGGAARVAYRLGILN